MGCLNSKGKEKGNGTTEAQTPVQKTEAEAVASDNSLDSGLSREQSRELMTTKPLDIQAKHATHAEIKDKIRQMTANTEDSETLTQTLISTVDLLASGVGGMIVSVIHSQCLQKPLRFQYLDGGLHTGCMRKICNNINCKEFGDFLKLLTAHNDTDRWEDHELKALCECIPAAHAYQEKLMSQPKDGGIVVSHLGTIKGAAMHIKYPSSRLQLVKPNGTSAGTRHASALGFAEHLCQYIRPGFYPGVVFARSDGGGAHAFCPEPDGNPTVFMFDTLKIPGQQEIIAAFKDKIMTKGKLMRKDQQTLARPAKIGETVVTVVDGEVISEHVVKEPRMVIRGNNPNQEFYSIPVVVFEKTYEMPGTSIKESDPDEAKMSKFLRASQGHLTARGFKLYHPRKGQFRWVYEVTEEDMKGFASNVFRAPWDASVLQPVRPGTFLTMLENGKEIWNVPRDAVSTLKEVDAITKEDSCKVQL